VLRAITLPLAIATTTMGIFNTVQIEALKAELFELKENTGRLFEVIQDFSKNMQAIKNSFNELRTTLLASIMFNLVLFNTHLSRLENQIWHQLQRVSHAIQAAIQHCFTIDYLNPKELITLFNYRNGLTRLAVTCLSTTTLTSSRSKPHSCSTEWMGTFSSMCP
jgi:hypothetical protein